MRHPALSFSVALLAAIWLVGCGRKPAPPATQEEPLAAVPRTIDKGDGCTVEITKDGAGPVARIGDEVTLAYEAKVKDSDQPIASTHGWDVPLRVRLGEPGILPGLARGLEGLRAGSTARIEVPPALGYGKDGSPAANVPADATLVFEVEVRGVRP